MLLSASALKSIPKLQFTKALKSVAALSLARVPLSLITPESAAAIRWLPTLISGGASSWGSFVRTEKAFSRNGFYMFVLESNLMLHRHVAERALLATTPGQSN